MAHLPCPVPARAGTGKELDSLGRVLLQFYRAVNLLYRKSVEGKQPEWVARWLDQGKPAELIALQRAPAFKNEVPRVIRPDLLITEDGLSVTELDSVPGGIGLTGWLNQTYSQWALQVLGGGGGHAARICQHLRRRAHGPHRRVRRSRHLSPGNGLAGRPVGRSGSRFRIRPSRFRRRRRSLSLLRAVRPGQRAQREADSSNWPPPSEFA